MTFRSAMHSSKIVMVMLLICSAFDVVTAVRYFFEDPIFAVVSFAVGCFCFKYYCIEREKYLDLKDIYHQLKEKELVI